ncbi:MAG: hypothetical protein ACREUU_14030, partial [Gammaproteobacteria bacterium]
MTEDDKRLFRRAMQPGEFSQRKCEACKRRFGTVPGFFLTSASLRSLSSSMGTELIEITLSISLATTTGKSGHLQKKRFTAVPRLWRSVFIRLNLPSLRTITGTEGDSFFMARQTSAPDNPGNLRSADKV